MGSVSADRLAAKRAAYADPTGPPAVLAPVLDGIPAALRAELRWAMWKLVWIEERGAWAKVPFRSNGRKAKPNDPETWATYEAAAAAYRKNPAGWAGVGYMLGGGWVGVDLDGVRDPATGELDPAAAELVRAFGTYTEVSPSGAGVKLFGRADWRGAWHKKPFDGGAEIEVYGDTRFFCVTGIPTGATDATDVQAAADVLATRFANPPRNTAPRATPADPPTTAAVHDDVLIAKATAAQNGGKFSALWAGDTSGHGGDASRADLALCGMLVFWTGRDLARVDRLFRRSGLMRPKWDERHGADGRTYGQMTVQKADQRQTEVYTPPHSAGVGAPAPAATPPAWPDPVPLTPAFDPPAFPAEVLPRWAGDFAAAVAEEKQVPVDLPALLVLGALAAGVARKVVVTPWDGWTREPVNLFALCALPPGERKSQTFGAVFAPVMALEADLRAAAEPVVREAESQLRIARKRVEHLEGKIAKEDDGGKRECLKSELRTAGDELAALPEPVLPLLRVDDDTPEMLALELVKQGGRVLAASPEARTLENIDRYSDAPNLDVFLKGHAGDDLRSGRVGRGRDAVDRPALTCCYTPQPCVLEGMGETPEMRGRGFLARWFFSLPRSAVGYRKVRGAAVPAAVTAGYEAALIRAWRTDYADPEKGIAHELRFDAEAVAELERFEGWKERELRPGGLLAGLGGWGNKLGGLCVRLCGLFHVADRLAGNDWRTAPIPASVVRRAVTLCREYAVPHARGAFALMGDSAAVVGAKAVLKWLASRDAPAGGFSKRDAFNGCRGAFPTVDELQPALDLLERHHLIRQPEPASGERRGPGRPASPVYEVNPTAFRDTDHAQNAHNTQKPGCGPDVGITADSANCARGGFTPILPAPPAPPPDGHAPGSRRRWRSDDTPHDARG